MRALLSIRVARNRQRVSLALEQKKSKMTPPIRHALGPARTYKLRVVRIYLMKYATLVASFGTCPPAPYGLFIGFLPASASFLSKASRFFALLAGCM